MQVLLSFRSGHPNGYWVNSRTYFTQGAKHSVVLNSGNVYELSVPKNAIVFCIINEIIARRWGNAYINTTERIEGDRKIYRYVCDGGTISITLIVEL